MIPFCDNKLCRLHSIEVGKDFQFMEFVEEDGRRARVRRMILADANKPGQTWAFCEICANAVAMVNERQ